jgi:hypothetical protein
MKPTEVTLIDLEGNVIVRINLEKANSLYMVSCCIEKTYDDLYQVVLRRRLSNWQTLSKTFSSDEGDVGKLCTTLLPSSTTS